jgi:hypothetical protein
VSKAESNRLNARRSTGPRDSSATRLNAVTHGLAATGITAADDPGAYESLAQRLAKTFGPVGDLEEFLVERIAFHITRLQRAARLEAEYINRGLEITFSSIPLDTPAFSAVQRYETAIENKLYRAINQLERLQRIRKGEPVPAPQSVDVSLHNARSKEP